MGDGEVEIIGIPRVEITHEALERIFAYIDAYPKEIAGLGRVERVGDATYRVVEVFLVEQWGNTHTNVDISEGAARFTEQLAAQDLPTAPYRFWWHSHVNFAAQWSATDTGTAKAFGMDFLIAFVGNKRREFRVRFELYRPVRVIFENLPLHVIAAPLPKLEAIAQADIAKFVHERPLGTEYVATKPVPVQVGAWSGKQLGPPMSAETRALVNAPTAVSPQSSLGTPPPLPVAHVAPLAVERTSNGGAQYGADSPYAPRPRIADQIISGTVGPPMDAPVVTPSPAPYPKGTTVTALPASEREPNHGQQRTAEIQRFRFAFDAAVVYLDRGRVNDHTNTRRA